MAWQATPFHEYGGLDLRSSPDNSACLDGLNFDLDRPGAVRSRNGYDLWATATGTDIYQRALVASPSLSHVVVGGRQGTGGRGFVLDTSGNLVASGTSATMGAGAADGIDQAVAIGTPASTRVYVCGGLGSSPGSSVQRWDGAAWSTPATLPVPRVIGLQSTDNRLVAGCTGATGGPAAAASSVHHVWFSNAGDPETWGANDFVQLTPGDGQYVTALVSWGERLFAFKNDRAFVFSGNSVDNTGGSVFNYQPLSETVGAILPSCAAAGPDGVYFLHRTGVYRTDGVTVQEVSGALRPWFEGQTLPFFGQALPADPISIASLSVVGDRVFARVGTTGTTITFVYYIATGQWACWSAANPISGVRIKDRSYLVINGSVTNLMRFRDGLITDDGTLITSHYQTGFSDLGSELQKDVVETTLWGSGTVSVALARDFGSPAGADSVTLGTSPAIARASAPAGGLPATVVSHKFSSTAAWAVYRTHHEVGGARVPGAN